MNSNFFKLEWLVLLFLVATSFAQEKNRSSLYSISPKFLAGHLTNANLDFPDRNLEKAIFLDIAFNNKSADWSKYFNHPKYGLSIGFTDYGNLQSLGQSYSLLQFIEFDFLKSKKLKLNIGVGLSYFNKTYDPLTNYQNQGITNHINTTFRSSLYYNLFKKINLGVAYYHHSNGHVSLPNNGFNSFLVAVSNDFLIKDKPTVTDKREINETENSQKQSYISFKVGWGENVLSQFNNDKKSVYSFSVEYGKESKEMFRYGVGLYYRFYGSYYNYIENDGELVTDLYPHFKDNPFLYSSNLGVSFSGEIMFGNIGVLGGINLNIVKPFYKVDWQLNGKHWRNSDGTITEVYQELDLYYELKRTISTKLGLRYYILNRKKHKKFNVFIDALINANFGQADFHELGFGVIHRL